MTAVRRFSARERIKMRIRRRSFGVSAKPRVSVFRSGRHVYAQAIDDARGVTLFSASTLDGAVRELAEKLDNKKFPNQSRSTKSCAAARAVGMVLAERAKAQGVADVIFDRNGFLYHGRIRAVAEGAREGGLKF